MLERGSHTLDMDIDSMLVLAVKDDKIDEVDRLLKSRASPDACDADHVCY